MPGPPPKREAQRRRNNKPAVPTDRAVTPTPATVEADPTWHPVALRWFNSLERSGQSAFYAESDWMSAYVLAESMSREFNLDEPPKAASLAAWFKGMSSLMVMEGDRRRAHLELDRAEPAGEEEADVSELAIYRRRLQSG